ncbi:MAG: hypothetical protein IPH01_00580 [Elusimicrobia bacterium]|nr:hypothetical protein [Elusimicrobiota bacterium]
MGLRAGGGIEKALAVRQGIEKVFYSEGDDLGPLSVRSDCRRKCGPKRADFFRRFFRYDGFKFRGSKIRKARPRNGDEPFLEVGTNAKCGAHGLAANPGHLFANTGHSYWDNFD